MTRYNAIVRKAPLLRWNPAWTIPALFVLAIGLRALLMLAFPQAPQSDGAFYMERAAEMARGMGYQEAGHPTAFWPVGYPAALAGAMMVVGSGMAAAMLLNLLAAAGILALILWTMRHLTGNERAARWAGLLYALYPAHIAYTGTPLSETVSTALAMAAVAALLRWRHHAPGLLFAGLLFGASTLMRAQMWLFPAGLLVLMLIALKDLRVGAALKAGIIVHLGLFAIVLPWTLRNQAQLGAPVMVSTNSGVALWTGANDLATGDHMYVERSALWSQVGIPFEQRVERQVEMDRRQRDLATQWIAEHPVQWLTLGLRKITYLWSKDSDGFWGLSGSYPDQARLWTAAQWLNQAYYALLLLLAAVTGWAALRAVFKRDRTVAPLLLLFAMPAFVTLTAFMTTGQVRYHYPAMPFLILAAGYALARLAEKRTAPVPDRFANLRLSH